MLKLFPTLSPKNKGVWEKSGVSWEKSGHFWKKSHVSWEKGNLVNNIVHAPHTLKGAEAPIPGQSPRVNKQSTMQTETFYPHCGKRVKVGVV